MAYRWKKKDAHGQALHPGDVCVRLKRSKTTTSTIEFCVYERESFGGKGSKGEFGRFITPDGKRSIKYSSVIFAFDPMGDRHSKAEQVKELVRQFYEEK